MVLVRQAHRSDLDRLTRLAKHLDSYNLPADRKALSELLRVSDASFAGRIASGLRRYLFVAETSTGEGVVGCSMVLARHGTPKLPHLSFKVDAEERRSRSLRRLIRHVTLTLSSDPRGYTEVGGLVVLPSHRAHPERIGRLLSYARFVYMAAHPGVFLRRLLVEYQPRVDPDQGNKLWQYVGQHFTGLTYHEADRLSASNKEFILSLFPKDKIYTSVLPYSAQRNIGTVSPGARLSRRLLEKQGFRYSGQVDPFDGGPHYTAAWKEVPLLRSCRRDRVVAPGEFRGGGLGRYLVMSGGAAGVRIVRTQAARSAAGLCLPSEALERLAARPGQTVRAVEDP